MSEDPIRAGQNWYTYCNNNPIKFIDPLGLASVNLVDYSIAMGAEVNEYTKNGEAYANITYGNVKKNYKLNSGIMDDEEINSYVSDWQCPPPLMAHQNNALVVLPMAKNGGADRLSLSGP